MPLGRTVVTSLYVDHSMADECTHRMRGTRACMNLMLRCTAPLAKGGGAHLHRDYCFRLKRSRMAVFSG
jgi:hypothetical protein